MSGELFLLSSSLRHSQLWECIDWCSYCDSGSIPECHALRTCCWWTGPTIIKWTIPWREKRFWYWDLRRWRSDTSDLKKIRNKHWWFLSIVPGLPQLCHNMSQRPIFFNNECLSYCWINQSIRWIHHSFSIGCHWSSYLIPCKVRVLCKFTTKQPPKANLSWCEMNKLVRG